MLDPHSAAVADRPQLLLKLQRGWRLDEGGIPLSPKGVPAPLDGLPPGSEILSALPPSGEEQAGSAAERELRRFLWIVLPVGADAELVLANVRTLAGVNEACVASRPRA
jgi:hypothetical protein